MKYDSYIEIHQAYKEMKKTFDMVKDKRKEIEPYLNASNEVVLFGCGSSYWSSLSIARCLNVNTDKKAYAYKATEASMHLEEFKNRFDQPLFLIPSRSGASQELLIVMKAMKKYYPEAKLILISEYLDNPMEKMADINISIPYADEISVCQTRSFNCLVTAMLTIVGMISCKTNLHEELAKYLENAQSYYEHNERVVKKMVETMQAPQIVTLGSGIGYGTMIEGAYIVVEMAQERACFYQTLEYRHGPIVCTDSSTYLFVCHTNPENTKLEINIAKEAKDMGAKIVLCGFENEEDIADYSFPMQTCCEEIKGLYFTSILQSVAYYLAIHKGPNPDKPKDLVKFIQY